MIGTLNLAGMEIGHQSFFKQFSRARVNECICIIILIVKCLIVLMYISINVCFFTKTKHRLIEELYVQFVGHRNVLIVGPVRSWQSMSFLSAYHMIPRDKNSQTT